MAHFYLDESLQSATVGDSLTLMGAEARHAASVSRLRVGESVLLGNGRGLIANVEATAVERDSVAFVVRHVEIVVPPTTRVTLVQALTKGDRDERAIEAATELGIDDVVPWAASRCVSIWSESKAGRGVERWRTIVREASKQSIRAHIPELHDYMNIERLLESLAGQLILVLDPTGAIATEVAWARLVAQARTEGQGIAIIVGPEGGITPAELDRFESSGAVRVSLGSSILRSSTAGPAFLAAINGALGRW
jgi:16S rRNA (uracil1498-N3)-methyltransferase